MNETYVGGLRDQITMVSVDGYLNKEDVHSCA
jgi:hypothetical protein